MRLKNANTALIYDRVNTPFGGAEQVLVALHELFPEAPLFTAVYNPSRATWAKDFNVRPSFLQHIPFVKTNHRQFVPLMPMAFESFHLKKFDLVISVTSAEAKGVKTSPDQLHICYLLTPTRYLWSHGKEYEKGVLKFVKRPIFTFLRQWDRNAARRPDHYIAISQLIANRCQQYYQRKVDAVVYPPFFPLPQPKKKVRQEQYFLVVSRLVSYKNIATAIKVCVKNNWNLKIVGDGPQKNSLRQLAKGNKNITFLQTVDTPTVATLSANATAFLLPNQEDFGIAALESLSIGTPVITIKNSGIAELIRDGKTGILLPNATMGALTSGITALLKKKWNKKLIKSSVAAYNKKSFQENFLRQIEKLWNNYQKENL